MTQSARLASFRKKRGWPGVIKPINMARAGFIFLPDDELPDNCRCFMCKVEINGWTPEDEPIDEHLRHNPDCAWARVLGLEDHTVTDRLATFIDWPHPSRRYRPSPLALAQAGFFFDPTARRDDTVECAYCHICLNKWAPDDIPLEEHRNASPECDHVLRCFETSSLVESSLGVIPVLEPHEKSRRLPDSSYEQSVYGNVLGSPHSPLSSLKEEHESIKEETIDQSIYETAPGVTDGSIEEQDTLSPREQVSDVESDKTPRDEFSLTPQPNDDSLNMIAAPNSSGNYLVSDLSAQEESVQDELMAQSSQHREESQLKSDDDGEDQSMHQSFQQPEYSMVTVEVDEITVDQESDGESDGASETGSTEEGTEEGSANQSSRSSASPARTTINLDDPETPSNSTPSSAPASEPPKFSVFQSAFTSTPFGRMSPTKMISTAPMPSPLTSLPIDLARPSFGTSHTQDQSTTTASMYPRLPSFPSMQQSVDEPFKEPYARDKNEEEPFGQPKGTVDQSRQEESFSESKKDSFDHPQYKEINEESQDQTMYHSAEGDGSGDRSTPSPVRSPMRSSIIGSSPVRSSINPPASMGISMSLSSPVRNSFDQLIERLDTPSPPPVQTVRDDSLCLSFAQVEQILSPQQHLSPQHDSLIENELDSELSALDMTQMSNSLEIEISKPMKKELVEEFKAYLSPSSIEFLMDAKSQLIGEWQTLLADEVERQIHRITEDAIERAEEQRTRIIQEIKAQYGQ